MPTCAATAIRPTSAPPYSRDTLELKLEHASWRLPAGNAALAASRTPLAPFGLASPSSSSRLFPSSFSFSRLAVA